MRFDRLSESVKTLAILTTESNKTIATLAKVGPVTGKVIGITLDTTDRPYTVVCIDGTDPRADRRTA